MKACAHDLHERVAAATGQPGRIGLTVAGPLSLAVSFVSTLLDRQCTSGRVTGRLRHEPDATLAAQCIWPAAIGGPAVCR